MEASKMTNEAEDATLILSQMQREAEAVIARDILAQKPWQHPMVAAWAKQMVNDPKLANEALTGRCEWDSGISTYDLDALGMEASNAAYDLQVANPDWRYGRKPDIATRIYKLYAAESAFCDLYANRKIEEKWARIDEDDTAGSYDRWHGTLMNQGDFI